MAKKTYQGSCHCKKVSFTAGIDLAEGTGKCNCTFCWKQRAWSSKAKPEDFTLKTGADALSEGAKGGFCKSCGVLCFRFADVAEWNPTAYYSVMVSSLDDADHAELAASPITYYDGKNDNWWNQPEQRNHL